MRLGASWLKLDTMIRSLGVKSGPYLETIVKKRSVLSLTDISYIYMKCPPGYTIYIFTCSICSQKSDKTLIIKVCPVTLYRILFMHKGHFLFSL